MDNPVTLATLGTRHNEYKRNEKKYTTHRKL